MVYLLTQVFRSTTTPINTPSLVKGLDDALEPEITGCEWSENEKNIISYLALEHRKLPPFMDNETQMIRLVCRKPQQSGQDLPKVIL